MPIDSLPSTSTNYTSMIICCPLMNNLHLHLSIYIITFLAISIVLLCLLIIHVIDVYRLDTYLHFNLVIIMISSGLCFPLVLVFLLIISEVLCGGENEIILLFLITIFHVFFFINIIIHLFLIIIFIIIISFS